jgi:hypothetical protein
MIYHMLARAENLIERASLVRATSILDLLAAGWRPGYGELDAAAYIERWTLLPRGEGRPYYLIGVAWLLPVKRQVIISAVLAIDRAAHWARVWDEWIVIGDQIDGALPFDADEVQRAGYEWLLTELRRHE